ncbi:DNA primase [Mesorhizobium sp. LNJC384A00]|nr:DNA primase [Mesorhizobium sp. LNJC384A00]
MADDSEFLHHEPCPECGSSDALGRYTDGHGHCFSCGHYEPGDGQPATERKERTRVEGLIPSGSPQALVKRSISEETCRKWGYTTGEFKGQTVQIATYRDTSGTALAQKVRFKNKDFKFLGDTKSAGLYGQHLWRDGGKRIVVTEGEIDALSVSQVQGNKWPVVSVPNGAQGAKKSLQKSIQYLLGFDEVVLMFDDDEPGQDAARECAMIFPPGRCKIARIDGHKDANEALQAGDSAKIVDAIFGARAFRPDGVVSIADVKDKALIPTEMGLPWFGKELNYQLYGRRLGEIIAIGAGTGVGKTEFLAKQIYYDLTTLNEPVGVFLLEQQPHDTVKRIASTHAGKQFHVPNREGEEPRWTTAELTEAIGEIEDRKLFMYDSFGATDWDVIKSTIRFLAHSEGVRLFYLDHLTALAAAADEEERVALEGIMAEMGSLVQELNVTIHMVSHLATPDGTPHEEGGRVMIRHFKGSRSIGFWCVTMLGLERDQQHEDKALRCVTTVRVLKHRPVGAATGETIFYRYDGVSGRLLELDHNPFEEENDTEDFSGEDDLPF